jgi:hypothetical protein
MIELECKKVLFYSEQDEATFFSWAQSISAIRSVTGRGSSIILSLKPRVVSDRSLREIVALFQRYHVSMKQLGQFKSPQNKIWFAVPNMFWYKSVFGAVPTKRSSTTRRKRRAA